MKVVITHGYTDLNKGDVAIAFGTIKAIHRMVLNAQIKSHSNFSEKHVNFQEHTHMMRQAGIPVVEGTLPSPYLDDDASGLLANIKAVIRLFYELICLGIMLAIPPLRFIHSRKARALDDLRDADLVIVRGGQYLHNESGHLRGLLFLGRMLINIAVPIWLKKPTVIWGMSIGPIHGKMSTRFTYRTIRACRKIIVREQYSADYLHQLGLVDNVAVAPDLAYLTTPIGSGFGALTPRPRIAVTVLNWSYPGFGQTAEARERYLEAVFSTLVIAFREHGLNPMIVQQVTARHHGQDDKPILVELANRLRSTKIPFEVSSDDLTPGELCTLYGNCEVALSSRLHAIILAACAGTPSIGISYQGFKTLGIMEGLGLGAYAHDIGQLTSSDLSRDLALILNQGGSLREKVCARVNEFQRQIDLAGCQIIEAINL